MAYLALPMGLVLKPKAEDKLAQYLPNYVTSRETERRREALKLFPNSLRSGSWLFRPYIPD